MTMETSDDAIADGIEADLDTMRDEIETALSAANDAKTLAGNAYTELESTKIRIGEIERALRKHGIDIPG